MMRARDWHHLVAATVENRAPNAADMRHLLHRAGGDHTKAGRVVHHVTLHLHGLPPFTSSAFELHIGDEHITHYHAVPTGIAFRVHHVDDLSRLYGQPIRFVGNRGQTLNTGQRFPDLRAHLTQTVGHHWRKVYGP
ncbi:hypothetical protein AACH06_07115 [Ideonella sp. DXS29W]|uniref:Uncharacterized protein n=1 Tax=Ideonella lacteola TaxID=2984193 RepID=A0ABU9BKV2_9BURK